MVRCISIVFHSSAKAKVDKIIDGFKLRNLNINILNENDPEKLSIRADSIRQTYALVVITSRDFQKTLSCMEILHYAKDLKLDIYSINPYSNYKPFGSLGSISWASKYGLMSYTNDSQLDEILDKVSLSVQQSPEVAVFVGIERPKSSARRLSLTNNPIGVLISYHPDNELNAKIVYNALSENNIEAQMEDTTKAVSNVQGARVVLVVLSTSYEANKFCEQMVQITRSLKKPLIPISPIKGLKLTNWLGLTVAGKLYYRIIDEQQAYKAKHDLSVMSDLLGAVDRLLNSSEESQDDIDKKKIDELKKKLDECKKKLTSWPPRPRVRIERPVKVLLKVPKVTKGLLPDESKNYIIYRTTYKLEQITKFDCMISYQWDYQNIVRSLYMNLKMKLIDSWFDIWGGMLGNSNDAMSRAVEVSKCMVVFLSRKYQESSNCQMEFKYALACKKPIILIRVEPNCVIMPLIEPYINDTYQFDLFSEKDMSEMINDVAKVDLIAQAIRDVSNAQPDDDVYELNEQVEQLQETLYDALEEINKQSNSNVKQCTRCRKHFNDIDRTGCKKHISYYLGGQLISGRWVCCNQKEKDDPGCKDAEHIDVARVWTRDQNYGTCTWQPN